MEVTHLGHAAVLIEAANTRVLIDPGNLSSQWHGLTGLDAVLVTHLHADHIDVEQVPELLAANPDAQLLMEPGAMRALDLGVRSYPLMADSQVDVGGLSISVVGGLHAVIHRDIPRLGNVGLVIDAPGEPRFFHPGDSLATTPLGIDVVAVPAYGPWAAMKETIDFARAIKAREGFLIHEAMLNDQGLDLVYSRLSEMTSTQFHDTREKRSFVVR